MHEKRLLLFNESLYILYSSYNSTTTMQLKINENHAWIPNKIHQTLDNFQNKLLKIMDTTVVMIQTTYNMSFTEAKLTCV